MRKLMEEAGLSPPLFESFRNRDLFVATFFFHHFLTEEDIAWLSYFKEFELSDEQAKALVFLREVGAINNTAYRNLNHVDTLTASASLRQMKEYRLLDVRNKGVATYYEPGPKIQEVGLSADQAVPKEHELDSKRHQLEGKEQELDSKRHQLEGKEQVLGSKEQVLGSKEQVLGSKEHVLRSIESAVI